MAERPLFLGRSQPAARINRPPTAGDFHTCGLRSVFLTHTPQGGFSCRFAAIHLLSSEKTIKAICRREAAKSATLLARAGVGCSKRGG